MAVISGEFVCPTCGALLRIQRRGMQAATVTCPECETTLQVQQSLDGELLVTSGQLSTAAGESGGLDLPRKSRNTGLLAVLAVSLVVVGGLVLWISATEKNPIDVTDVSPETEAEEPVAAGPVRAEVPLLPPEKPAEPGSQPQPNLFADRLNQLGQRVNRFREEHSAFPPAQWESGVQNREQSFSWLAGLDPALKNDSSLLPQWNLPWNDPLNDRFVRRKRSDLLNPEIAQQVSPERYPAGHVVGIAGVGEDGPTLPPAHPRAGIFGDNRSTRVDQVKDGLSNTMLAAGVTSKIASWADGNASLRPLTAEPYVNGPDGLGTGQADGMYVLMADGSVRFVSSKTSPLILRRMAAMADGLPLDEAIPGEPGETALAQNPPASEKLPDPPKPQLEMPQVTQGEKKSAEPAVPPEKMAPPQPSVDFNTLLAETVVVYQLASAAPLEEVLVELEALFGVRIEFDAVQIPADNPERRLPVRIDGKNITYDDLLRDALDETPFAFEIRDQHLVIIRK